MNPNPVDPVTEEVQNLEKQVFEISQKLSQLRKKTKAVPISDYEFNTLDGSKSLKDLFAGKSQLMLIHNMGQGCRYCTLWADGINPFLPHLETVMSVVLVSKDDPETQRRLANQRQWRFRMASHGGGRYIQEQSVMSPEGNFPGVVLYEMRDQQVYRLNRALFGPYDQFCSFWNLISLAGLDAGNFTPQFSYWKRPEKMDDGGENLNS